MKVYLLLIPAGVLCFFYGLAVLAVKSGTRFFLVWLGGGAFLTLWGLAGRLGLTGGLPAPLRRGFWALVGAGLLLCMVCAALMLTRFFEKGTPGADYLVVLGAQVRSDGPSRVLRRRLDSAAAYLQENEGTVCVVSGGQGANEPWSEAEGMADYLVRERGIDPHRILQEDQSADTAENLRFSLERIRAAGGGADASVCVVTNNFHMYRALGIAKRQGMTGVSGLAAGSDPFYLPNNMLRECAGILKDKLAGNL